MKIWFFLYNLNLPVLTWYFSVVTQSWTSCCRGKPVSGTSKSSIFFISSGWWNSRTFSFRSFVAFTWSSRTLTICSRNSRVSGTANVLCGSISVWLVKRIFCYLWLVAMLTIGILSTMRCVINFSFIKGLWMYTITLHCELVYAIAVLYMMGISTPIECDFEKSNCRRVRRT